MYTMIRVSEDETVKFNEGLPNTVKNVLVAFKRLFNVDQDYSLIDAAELIESNTSDEEVKEICSFMSELVAYSVTIKIDSEDEVTRNEVMFAREDYLVNDISYQLGKKLGSKIKSPVTIFIGDEEIFSMIKTRNDWILAIKKAYANLVEEKQCV